MFELEEIVNALSDEQKISFICSEFEKSDKIYNTGINTLNFKSESISNSGSLYQAAISLNDSLISNYISNLYNSSKDIHIATLSEKTNLNLNSISTSPYLNGHFLSLFVKSLEENNVDCAFVIPNTDNNIDRAANINKVSKDILVYPEYFITTDYLAQPRFATYRFKNQLVINSNDIKTIVKCLNNGYSYALCNLNTKNLLIKSLRDYDYFKKELEAQHITESKLKELEDEGKILNRDILDKLVYKRIERIHNKNQIRETKETNSNIDYSELTIMYKNDGILPLKKEDVVTIIGSFSRENELNIDVLEDARKYNLNSNQYCHGYKMDNSFNEALYEEAILKSADSLCLVYVGTNDLNSPNIPDNQIKLLEKLKENGRKIICVCYKYQYFDKRILDYSNAILQISDLKALSFNIFDIIYGKKSPSGKTLWYTPKDDETLINPNDFRTYLYPFGYGLSYGKLRIADCNILDGYIEFGVTNDSDYESKFSIFLEVDYNDTGKNIKSYTKFSLKAHENSRISIPISNETFMEYNYDKHCYEIRGGVYNLILTEGNKELLTISIKLVEHIFDADVSNLEYEKNPDILSKEYESSPRPDLKRKKRFIFVTSFFIYALTMLFSLAIVFSNRGLYTARNILLTLAGILILLYLIHIVIFMFNKPKEVKKKTYEDLFNEMTEFKKNIDIVYPKPVKEDLKEEIVINQEIKKEDKDEYADIDSNLATEENLTVEQEEEIKILDAMANARVIDPENVTDGFIDYLNSKGLSISPKTVKEIFSTIPATKIILLKSNDKLKLERFVSTLQEYIDNEVISIDLKNNNSFNEMIMDSSSELSRLILNGARNKNNVIFGYVKNACKESFNKALMPFINKNINNSNINISIDGKKVNLSNNIYLLVELNDELENDYTVTIDCDLIDVDKKEFNGKIEFLNIDSLLNILRKHQNNIYLNEEDFKKFDDLINQLNSDQLKELSNRTTIDFDKIYLMLVLAGISKEEAIDMLLRMRLIPQIKKTEMYKSSREEVIKIISRIFNESQIPLSLKELKEEVSHE